MKNFKTKISQIIEFIKSEYEINKLLKLEKFNYNEAEFAQILNEEKYQKILQNDVIIKEFLINNNCINLSLAIIEKKRIINEDFILSFTKKHHKKQNVINFFVNFFSSKENCIKAINKNILNVEFLKIHPEDEEITLSLLKNKCFPKQDTLHLYNKKVIENADMLEYIFKFKENIFIYDSLPNEIKNHKKIYNLVLSEKPEIYKKEIFNLEFFLNSLVSKRFNFAGEIEIYNFFEDIGDYDFICNDVDNVFGVFKYIKNNNFTCNERITLSYLEMDNENNTISDYCPAKNFINKISSKHDFIKDFFNREFGISILNFKVSSEFDSINFVKLIKNTGIYLEKHYLELKIQNTKTDEKIKINKI